MKRREIAKTSSTKYKLVASIEMADLETPTETNYQRSSMTTGESCKNYFCNLPLVLELIFSILVAALGHLTPEYIFRMSLHERDIPYQTTENGDVLLSLYLNNPYSGQTVPSWLNFVVAMLLPLLIAIFVTGVLSSAKNDLHSASCAFLFAIGSTAFITEFVKLYCGYLRPNFYQYCEFDAASLQCESSKPDDSRKSFPSGHASTSLCCTTLLTMLLLGKVGLHRACCRHAVNDKFYFLKKRLTSILSTLPIFLGIFIAASRVHDNMHHPADVVGGSVIGIGCAIFAHGLWYPSIYSPEAGCPIQTTLLLEQQKRENDELMIDPLSNEPLEE
mmetsp:Transcript_16244/g.23898  ORF Transcript_16244/g.23898 Transcript_16244/m.23898 type:complete len:332 (+) Transcript_16244:108-1103(+)